MLLASEAARALSSVSGWCSGAGAAAVHQVPDGVPPLRNLRSRGTGDCPVTAIMVTRCDGRDSTDVQYPPLWSAETWSSGKTAAAQIWSFCTACRMTARPQGGHLSWTQLTQPEPPTTEAWRNKGRWEVIDGGVTSSTDHADSCWLG